MGSRNIETSSVRYRWNVIAGGILSLLASVLYVVNGAFTDRVPGYFSEVVLTSLVFGLAFLIVYAVGLVLDTITTGTALTRHQHEVVYRFAQLATFGTALLLVTIPIWEFTVENVLLGAGVISVVLAIAARKTLGSILSGVIIMSTDVFRVGDWVKIDERFGRIDRISLFNTQITSPQGETHIFPNDEITTRDITNLGHNRYRNDILIGIDYNSDIPDAIATCDTLLQGLTEAAENRVDGFNPTSVKSFDDSQITLAVKVWIHEPTPWAINQAQTTVLSKLHTRFQEEGIEIPFPQRAVSQRTPGDAER